jgi:hypothetical protein
MPERATLEIQIMEKGSAELAAKAAAGPTVPPESTPSPDLGQHWPILALMTQQAALQQPRVPPAPATTQPARAEPPQAEGLGPPQLDRFFTRLNLEIEKLTRAALAPAAAPAPSPTMAPTMPVASGGPAATGTTPPPLPFSSPWRTGFGFSPGLQSMTETMKREEERQRKLLSAEQERLKEQRERLSRTQMGLGFAGQGLAAAGMPSLGGLVSGISAGLTLGPIGAVAGAAIATFSMLSQKIIESIQTQTRIATGVAAQDVTQVARGFADLARTIPLVGERMSIVGHGALDIGESLTATARRLARYSPQLAAEMARIDVERIQRDVMRAQTQGSTIAGSVRTYYDFRTKLEDYITQNGDRILAMMQRGITILEFILRQQEGIQALEDPLRTLMGDTAAYQELMQQLQAQQAQDIGAMRKTLEQGAKKRSGSNDIFSILSTPPSIALEPNRVDQRHAPGFGAFDL